MIFKNFTDQDWIGFNFIGSGLDSDGKISQSAHLCSARTILFIAFGVTHQQINQFASHFPEVARVTFSDYDSLLFQNFESSVKRNF